MALSFRRRLPVGFYAVPAVATHGGEAADEAETEDGRCEILIYDSNQNAFESFLAVLPDLCAAGEYQGRSQGEPIPHESLDRLTRRAEVEFFQGIDRLPGYRVEDIEALIRYFHESGKVPNLIRFQDRDKYDVDRLAERIRDEARRVEDRVRLINEAWGQDDSPWREFFADSKSRFLAEVNRSLQRLDFPTDFAPEQPTVQFMAKDFESCTLQELKQIAPDLYRELTEPLLTRDADGNLRCKECRRRSKNRWDFHFDHKKPRQHGGKTRADNLQLLCWQCNYRKGGSLAAEEVPSDDSERH